MNDLRIWLDNEGFDGKFVGWKPDALIGAKETAIAKKFQLPEEEERLDILLGLLETAKSERGRGTRISFFILVLMPPI